MTKQCSDAIVTVFARVGAGEMGLHPCGIRYVAGLVGVQAPRRGSVHLLQGHDVRIGPLDNFSDATWVAPTVGPATRVNVVSHHPQQVRHGPTPSEPNALFQPNDTINWNSTSLGILSRQSNAKARRGTRYS